MNKRLQLQENKSIVLLTAALVIVIASTIGNAGWTEQLNRIPLVGLGVIVIGLLLSRSLLPALLSHLFSVIIGSAWSFWVISRLLPAQLTWSMRWHNLVERITVWLAVAIHGGVSYDNLMFILQMGLIVWVAGYLTIWFVFRRRNVWAAVVPGGTIILIVFHYAPRNLSTYVFAFLLFSLLLVIRFNLMENEQRWRAHHVYFRPDIRFDFLREGLIFSIVIVALAWFAPAIDQKHTVQLFGAVDREWRAAQSQWNRLFANLEYKPDPLAGVDTFSQSLTLSVPRTLTAEPVMLVQSPAGRYWRAAVYDAYDGQRWMSNDTESAAFGRNKAKISLPLFRARIPITQTYTLLKSGATVLYALSDPVALDRSAQAKVSPISPEQTKHSPYSYWAGKKQPWVEEITFIESDRRLRKEESYHVVSMFSVATKEQLQADTTTYPDWIKERYTQLPAGIPQRVFDLAKEITRNAPTPYDKASAIEAYLRKNIAYNEGIPLPPANRDKVDYILFDLKQAYCDYYATSMIVLLRSLGIPARMAAGYARGRLETLDNQEQAYLVQNKDAHSWVEVFFPTYGWIEFEPTAAQPVITRFTEGASGLEGTGTSNPSSDGFNPIDRVQDIDTGGNASAAGQSWSFIIKLPFWGPVAVNQQTSYIIFIVGLLGILGSGVWVIWTQYHPKQTAMPQDLPSITAIYAAMLKLASWIGLKKYPWQTSFEYVTQLQRTLPAVKTEVTLITTEYVRQTYSKNHTTSTEQLKRVTAAWDEARPQFYRALFDKRNPLKKIRLPFRW